MIPLICGLEESNAWAKKVEWWLPGGGVGNCGLKEYTRSVSRSVMSDTATPWTVACQAPLSMEFSRQEHWSRLPFPSPGESS